jgi:hypothetical protein
MSSVGGVIFAVLGAVLSRYVFLSFKRRKWMVILVFLYSGLGIWSSILVSGRSYDFTEVIYGGLISGIVFSMLGLVGAFHVRRKARARSMGPTENSSSDTKHDSDPFSPAH